MGRSKTFEASLALGDALISEGQFQHDTLGRWMSHDLANKLSAYKSATGTRRAEAAVEITSLIFQFWKHRQSLASGRPFENYDAVLRALESLDPTNKYGRYFNFDHPINPRAKNAAEQKQWLDMARTFDKGARSMVTMCVSAAAQAAGKPPEAWLKAAKVLADNNDLDVGIVIRLVTAGEEVDDEEVDLNAPQREKLKRISEQLKAMIAISGEFQSYLDKRLAMVKEPRLVRKSALKAALKSRKKKGR